MTSVDAFDQDPPVGIFESNDNLPSTTYFNLENASLFSSLQPPIGNDTNIYWSERHRNVYIIVPLIFILFCTISIGFNIRILISARWIRRPLSPTIFISLSLGLADTCSAAFIAIGLIINSLLPGGMDISIQNDCVALTIEACRLSCILISILHLLALACNHYFGILWPFRSKTMSSFTLRMIVAGLWVFPTTFIFGYFSSFENQGFQRSDCYIDPSENFLLHSQFRKTFSSAFFVPMVLMFAIYTHITIMVRRHQAFRRWFNRHSRRHDNLGNPEDEDRQYDKNLKAIWTSLLILSTYVICFMPVVLSFSLICNDCYFTFEEVGEDNLIILSSIANFLLISKYLLNPLIYASRMQEIKTAMSQMDADCHRALCTWGNHDEMERGVSSHVEGSQRFSWFSSSSRRQNIALTTIQVRTSVRSTRQMTTEL